MSKSTTHGWLMSKGLLLTVECAEVFVESNHCRELARSTGVMCSDDR